MPACEDEHCSTMSSKEYGTVSSFEKATQDMTEHIYYQHNLINFTVFRLGNFTLTDLLLEPKDTISNHRIWPYFFWITFVVGLVGNGLVIFVFIRKKPMRTVTNTYLINLAITDILYLISTIPNKTVLMDHWPFGEAMCKFISYLMNVTMTSSILTLTAVGIDRHYALLHPISSRKHRTIKRTVIFIITFWIFSCAVNSPTLLIVQKIELLEDNICLYVWEELWGRKTYSVSMFGVLYVLPQVILIVCYCRIGYKMWYSLHADDNTKGRAHRKLKNGRRIVKMAITVTITFFVCWLPIHLLELLMAFGTDFERAFHEFKLLAPLIPHLCIAANPFIYNFMSKTFHSHFKASCWCATMLSHKMPANGGQQEGKACETLEVPLQDFGNKSSMEHLDSRFSSPPSSPQAVVIKHDGNNKAFSELGP